MHSGSPHSSQISQWLQLITPWLLISTKSSHLCHCSVYIQPALSVSFSRGVGGTSDTHDYIYIFFTAKSILTSIQYLASVGLDDHHTLNVWDWKRGKVVATTRGHSDRIFDIQFSPHSPSELVTCGVKHIKFWTLRGNSLSGKKGLFGKKG